MRILEIMKIQRTTLKAIIVVVSMLVTYFSACAQESTMDYIYCGDGFELKRVRNDLTSSNESIGLYSKDGKILVSAYGDKYGRGSSIKFYVLDGCEIICSRAFQWLTSFGIYIPSSVIYIAPDALLTGCDDNQQSNRYLGIQNGCKEVNTSSKSMSIMDINATEVARYNINGIRLNEPTDGINIIQMSDGTTEKVIVK